MDNLQIFYDLVCAQGIQVVVPSLMTIVPILGPAPISSIGTSTLASEIDLLADPTPTLIVYELS